MDGNICGMICGAIPAFLWRDRGSSQKIYVRISCLIQDLNSGSSRYESVVSCLCRNFLFYIGLIWILCHVINTWYLSLGKCLSCHGPPYCSRATIPGNVLISSVGLLPSVFVVLCYMLDAELFPQHQRIPHGEHFVSIMKTLSSAIVCCPQSTQSALIIKTIESVVWLTQWHRSNVYREILEWWFFHRFFTFRIGYYCILLKYSH